MWHAFIIVVAAAAVYCIVNRTADPKRVIAWALATFCLAYFYMYTVTVKTIEDGRENYSNIPGLFGVHPYDALGNVWDDTSRADMNTLLDAIESAAGSRPVYLAFGTLLGWGRNQDFIPWDDDADVLVHEDDVQPIVDNLDQNKEVVVVYSSLLYRKHNLYKVYLRRHWDAGLRWPFVDIFTYNTEGGRINVLSSLDSGYDSVPSLSPMRSMFAGKLRWVPEQWEQLLNEDFGRQWRCEFVSSAYCHRTEMMIDPRYRKRVNLCAEVV